MVKYIQDFQKNLTRVQESVIYASRPAREYNEIAFSSSVWPPEPSDYRINPGITFSASPDACCGLKGMVQR
jgi:hypothetical protein